MDLYKQNYTKGENGTSKAQGTSSWDPHFLPQFSSLCLHKSILHFPLHSHLPLRSRPTSPKSYPCWENSDDSGKQHRLPFQGEFWARSNLSSASGLDLPLSLSRFAAGGGGGFCGCFCFWVFKVSHEEFGPDDLLQLLKTLQGVDLFSSIQLRCHPAINVPWKQFPSPLTNK